MVKVPCTLCGNVVMSVVVGHVPIKRIAFVWLGNSVLDRYLKIIEKITDMIIELNTLYLSGIWVEYKWIYQTRSWTVEHKYRWCTDAICPVDGLNIVHGVKFDLDFQVWIIGVDVVTGFEEKSNNISRVVNRIRCLRIYPPHFIICGKPSGKCIPVLQTHRHLWHTCHVLIARGLHHGLVWPLCVHFWVFLL